MHDIWGFLNSGIFLLLATVIGRYVKRIADRADEEKAHREQMLKELYENNQKLTAAVEDLKTKYESLSKQMESLRITMDNVAKGGLAMMKDRLLQSCRYFIERGSITMTAKNNLKGMWHFYHDVYHLNGDVEEYFNKMLRLPVDDIPIISSFDLDTSQASEKHYC